MAQVKPFKGVRPPRELVERVSARPYDVLSSDEARSEAEGNVMSLYHITRPEINLPSGTDEHDPQVYSEASRQYKLFKEAGWLRQDPQPYYYIYAQTWRDKTQYGIVVAASVEDYNNGVILRHEQTRRDKEDDRMRHIESCSAQVGPAFLAYLPNDGIRAVIERITTSEKAEYDFVSSDDIRHRMWLVGDPRSILEITLFFEKMPHLYIADGHHRSAAASRVAAERKANNPRHTGDEEYNSFLAVCFSADELTILDYNRVIKDLNGLTPHQVVERLHESFIVHDKGQDMYCPSHIHEFAMYIHGHWYALTPKEGTFDENDPIKRLDVSISSELILDKIFGIRDLRDSKRIDFVGGIRGLLDLKRRVDNGEAACALALYPTTMQQIIDVADSGNIMPPKATWFEPKLRSGIVIHEI